METMAASMKTVSGLPSLRRSVAVFSMRLKPESWHLHSGDWVQGFRILWDL